MHVEIRKSIAGTEYWDTKEKRTRFVPRGQEPDFEVSDNPTSMVTPEEKLFIGGKEIIPGTNNNEIVDSDGNTESDFENEESKENIETEKQEGSDDIDNMTIKQLREYAKKKKIDIPGAVRTRDSIFALIRETE